MCKRFRVMEEVFDKNMFEEDITQFMCKELLKTKLYTQEKNWVRPINNGRLFFKQELIKRKT